MCGIVGVYPLNRRTKTILMFGAYDMENRGDDSWGISNGTAIYKAVGPVTGGYRIPHNFQEGDAVVLHTRAASVGSVSVENSHPFRVTGTKKSIIGVHNGGVGNHKTLAEEANTKLVKANFPKFEYSVDSNALYMYMACGGDTSRVYGTGALVWWDWVTKLDKRLNFLRFNTEALHIVKLEDESIAWCSTKDTLVKAARMAGLKILFHYDIKGDTHYQLQPELMLEESYKPSDGYPIVNMGKMVFGTSTARNTSYQGCYSTGRSTEDDEIAEHYRNYHTPTRYSGAPWTTIHTGSISKIIYPDAAIIHDTGDDKDIEEAHNKVIYGNGWQRQGMGDICSLCKEAYTRTNNPGFVLRTKSNYICGTCINDVWLELIDGLTTGKLPLILGVTASSTPDTIDTTETIVKDIIDGTATTQSGPTNSSGEEGTEKNISIIPSGNTREGDARSSSTFEEDPADCYAEFGPIGC